MRESRRQKVFLEISCNDFIIAYFGLISNYICSRDFGVPPELICYGFLSSANGINTIIHKTKVINMAAGTH